MPNSNPPLPRRRRRLLLRIALALLTVLFLVFNSVAFLHAWSLTHYAPANSRTTRLREVRTAADKARLIFLGPTIRRMENTMTPSKFQLPYQTVSLPGSRGAKLEAWRIPGRPGSPVVLMFTGYGASKDTLLHAAAEFHADGCETWLVDFSGIGGSDGNTTTIGWREAEDVAAAARAIQGERHGPLVLYGASMGASAILCAQHRGLVKPNAVILECPFDRLSDTFGVRLKLLGIPRSPLAPAIAFWVGVQHGFNGLGHDPVNYARSVRCPVLLMQGENDPFVGRETARAIAAALGERATVKILPNCGHSYLARDGEAVWRPQVRKFLAEKAAGTRPLLSAAH